MLGCFLPTPMAIQFPSVGLCFSHSGSEFSIPENKLTCLPPILHPRAVFFSNTSKIFSQLRGHRSVLVHSLIVMQSFAEHQQGRDGNQVHDPHPM